MLVVTILFVEEPQPWSVWHPGDREWCQPGLPEHARDSQPPRKPNQEHG